MQAIKNVFRFIKWQWNRLETIPKLSLSAMFSVSLSAVTMNYPTVSNAFMIAAVVLLIVTLGSFISIILKEQYAKFKEERNSLFNKIKYSDDQPSNGTQV